MNRLRPNRIAYALPRYALRFGYGAQINKAQGPRDDQATCLLKQHRLFAQCLKQATHAGALSAKDERLMPLSAATRSTASMRHSGILPEVFQLETVDGLSLRDFATALVPPRALMMLVACAINWHYDNRNCNSSVIYAIRYIRGTLYDLRCFNV